MSRLSFSNWALLAGLAALIIPILIHLLLRRKKQRLRFSTLQFFLKLDENASQRRKLRNLALLAVRLLLVALLVVAFARPYLRDSAAREEGKTRWQIVLVIDRSASMQADQRWAKAKELLQKVIRPLETDDRVALVDGGKRAEIISPLVPPARLKPVLDKLQPGFGGGDLSEGLQQASRILSESATGRSSAVYVISDFQRIACEKIANVKIPRNIQINVLPVGEPELANVAVRGLSVGFPGSATAEVSNFSDRDAREMKMDLVIDGDASVAPSISVTAGASTNVVLPLPDLSPGWHTVEARVHSGDGFGLDDVRYLSLHVPPPLRVLCVEQRTGKEVFEEETYFVATALAPLATNRGPYIVTKVAPERLVTELGAAERCAFVLLPGLRQLSADIPRALRKFVAGGGGLLMFLGEGVSPSRYHSEFQELLPARLEHPEGEREYSQICWHLRDYAKESPVFAAFREPNSGDLSLPQFTRRFAVTPVDSGRVAARFNDDMPLVVAKDFGKGRIALVNTSVDTSWTDWPKRKTFVPWLHGLAAYAAGRPPSLTTAEAATVLAENSAEVDLGGPMSNRSLRLREPNGSESPVAPDIQGRVALTPAHPGFYSVRDAAGREVRPVAVNIPPSESDLHALTAEQVQRQIVRVSEPLKTSVMVGFLGHTDRELWRILLVVGLILLFLESLLANRTFA